MTENEMNEAAVETEAEQTTEQTAEQATEQVAEQATEQVAEPTAEQVAELTAEPTPERKSVRKVFGRVVSNAADKTVSVSIERVVKHPVYGKYIRQTSKVMAHDEDNACKLGDRVAIAECRPLSKRKSWRVVEVFGSNGALQ